MRRKEIFLTFLFFTIFIYSLSLSFSQSWLSDWQYRIPITITERSGNTLTDYQVLVVINTQNLISQGKMRSDCGDIRFTDSDGRTLLNYWIESGCNTNNTRIWVKVPNIPARSNKTIYLYYGNPNATSLSNISSVFIWTQREIFPNIPNSTWGSGSSNPEDTFNTYYHDARNEILIRASDFGRDIAPVNITALRIYVVQQPGRDLDNYRVRYQLTTRNQLTGTFTTSGWILVFGPTNLGRPSAGSVVTLNLNPQIIWTNHSLNLLLDLSRDTFSWVSGGGMYRKLVNIPNTMCTFWSDSGRVWPFDGTCNLRNYVPSIIFVGWFRKYISPEPTISLGNEETNLPFTAWANVTKSFSQAGNLCWRFYVNNSLGLWNSTPIDCSINIIPPEFSLEVKLVQPNENSINNLTVGESLNIRAHVKLKSQYNFCIDVNAYLRYNASSNMPDSLVPTSANSIMSNVNPISFNLCTNQEIPINFTIYANKPSFKVLDVNFCALNICNDTSDFYVNISIVATRDFKLRKGWNLISIPHKFIYFDLSNDDCNIREKIFHHYNASSNSWTYFTYDKLLPGISYWVYSEKDCTSKIAVSGTVNLSDLPKAIKGRKNFIGSLTSLTNLNQVAQYIGCNNPILRYWDTSTNSFRQSTILEPWRGYILECS
ncbi:MAG: DUF2341 domain-containing protein [Nanopusillaceae archaeon]